jgi:hypothetical protein
MPRVPPSSCLIARTLRPSLVAASACVQHEALAPIAEIGGFHMGNNVHLARLVSSVGWRAEVPDGERGSHTPPYERALVVSGFKRVVFVLSRLVTDLRPGWYGSEVLPPGSGGPSARNQQRSASSRESS